MPVDRGAARRAQRRIVRQRLRSGYDRRIALATSSARVISQWSAFAASLGEGARNGRLATAWIELASPRARLIRALARQEKLFGGVDGGFRLRTWPGVDCPAVLWESGHAAARVLTAALPGEAEFIFVMRIARD